MSETDPRRDALRCIECEFRTDDSPGGWYELSDHRRQTGHRYEHVKPARKPLTVADIPAGQGAASLFIGRASDGCPVLTFKDEDGDLIALEHGNPTTPSGRAFWDHLAATLPHVTTEED